MCARTDAVLAVHAAAQGLRSACLSRLPAGLSQDGCAPANLGLGALMSSTLLKKHKAGDHRAAAAEFARWVNAGGRRLPGLVRRRAAEAELYLS